MLFRSSEIINNCINISVCLKSLKSKKTMYEYKAFIHVCIYNVYTTYIEQCTTYVHFIMFTHLYNVCIVRVSLYFISFACVIINLSYTWNLSFYLKHEAPILVIHLTLPTKLLEPSLRRIFTLFMYSSINTTGNIL